MSDRLTEAKLMGAKKVGQLREERKLARQRSWFRVTHLATERGSRARNRQLRIHCSHFDRFKVKCIKKCFLKESRTNRIQDSRTVRGLLHSSKSLKKTRNAFSTSSPLSFRTFSNRIESAPRDLIFGSRSRESSLVQTIVTDWQLCLSARCRADWSSEC